jgi:hypothetical protein
VAKLIHSAGLAIQALTNAKPVPSDSSPALDGSLDSHKARFKEATSQYFALLSSLDVRLRRQVFALEEAEILPEDDETGDAGTATADADSAMDVDQLNNQKDITGMDVEAEVWAAVRQFVEGIEKPQAQNKAHDQENMRMD